jgi:hypothetical protein
VPSTERIGPCTDLSRIARVSVAASEFSEEVAATNIRLVEGYRRLRNQW